MSSPSHLQQEKILRGFRTLGLTALEISLRNNECGPPSKMQLSEWQTMAKWERKWIPGARRARVVYLEFTGARAS